MFRIWYKAEQGSVQEGAGAYAMQDASMGEHSPRPFPFTNSADLRIATHVKACRTDFFTGVKEVQYFEETSLWPGMSSRQMNVVQRISQGRRLRRQNTLTSETRARFGLVWPKTVDEKTMDDKPSLWIFG